MQAARRIIGAYPAINVGDPVTFAGTITAVLNQYPAGVVEAVSDPEIGVQTREKFLSPAVVREHCERLMEPIRRQQERQGRRRETDTLLLASPVLPREKRKTMAELQEECARRGLIVPGERHRAPPPKDGSEASNKILEALKEKLAAAAPPQASESLKAALLQERE